MANRPRAVTNATEQVLREVNRGPVTHPSCRCFHLCGVAAHKTRRFANSHEVRGVTACKIRVFASSCGWEGLAVRKTSKFSSICGGASMPVRKSLEFANGAPWPCAAKDERALPVRPRACVLPQRAMRRLDQQGSLETHLNCVRIDGLNLMCCAGVGVVRIPVLRYE